MTAGFDAFAAGELEDSMLEVCNRYVPLPDSGALDDLDQVKTDSPVISNYANVSFAAGGTGGIPLPSHATVQSLIPASAVKLLCDVMDQFTLPGITITEPGIAAPSPTSP